MIVSQYKAIPKVGARKRQWLIVNDHGGLREEFDGTRKAAQARARELSKRASNQLGDDHVR